MGLKVIYEKGDFSGGYCILKEEKLIVINKKFDPKHRAITLAQSLSEVGIENLFLKPAVSDYIEEQTNETAAASMAHRKGREAENETSDRKRT